MFSIISYQISPQMILIWKHLQLIPLNSFIIFKSFKTWKLRKFRAPLVRLCENYLCKLSVRALISWNVCFQFSYFCCLHEVADLWQHKSYYNLPNNIELHTGPKDTAKSQQQPICLNRPHNVSRNYIMVHCNGVCHFIVWIQGSSSSRSTKLKLCRSTLLLLIMMNGSL